MFVTAVVPRELLVKGDLFGIAKAVKLTDGSSFGVEAHGLWLTPEECAAFERNVTWYEMPWLNGLAPVLPPKQAATRDCRTRPMADVATWIRITKLPNRKSP